MGRLDRGRSARGFRGVDKVKNPTRFRRGNKAAQRGDAPADSHVHIRVPSETKARWSSAAESEGVGLSAWLTAAAESQCGKVPRNRQNRATD